MNARISRIKARRSLRCADAFADLGVRWFEEPVSSDDLEGLHLLRDQSPPGLEIAAGEYGYDLFYFRRMLDAGAVDVLQADATRCAGITGFLGAGTLCQARAMDLSAHTAPTLHAHAGCAVLPLRHVEYFYDHARIDFDLRTAEGIRTYRAFLDEASDLCLMYGGSLSAEHGDGQARAELLPKMYGEALVDAFRTFKRLWDPDWKMNPGKVVDPYRIDENLRLGTDYAPPALETYFQFPDDSGSFARAALRCVGVGKCRRMDVGAAEVMCPSYLATHEEMHSTRGRARLLFEMLNGDETPDAWDNASVKEALDLCLACKGCKNDCPVNVDMATYKAEFLAHYYRHHLRPRHAYAFALIFFTLTSEEPTHDHRNHPLLRRRERRRLYPPRRRYRRREDSLRHRRPGRLQ